jgi:hypothetical protein
MSNSCSACAPTSTPGGQGRSLIVAPVLAVLLAVLLAGCAASASLPDPAWIAGTCDESEFDDLGALDISATVAVAGLYQPVVVGTIVEAGAHVAPAALLSASRTRAPPRVKGRSSRNSS